MATVDADKWRRGRGMFDFSRFTDSSARTPTKNSTKIKLYSSQIARTPSVDHSTFVEFPAKKRKHFCRSFIFFTKSSGCFVHRAAATTRSGTKVRQTCKYGYFDLNLWIFAPSVFAFCAAKPVVRRTYELLPAYLV